MRNMDKPGRQQRPIKKNIVFLGAGNMAEALIKGMVGSGLVLPSCITATDTRPERLAYLRRKLRIKTLRDNRTAVGNADIIFLAVKPQQMESVLSETGASLRPSQIVISIAAGITSGYIERFLPKGTPVIRSMPNTPALLGAGAIALAAGKCATRAHIALSKILFSVSGAVVELPEAQINAVTALSGSGPAYVFYLAEAMTKAGVALGLPDDIAALLARQTVFGAGKMLGELSTPTAELRRNVTSPGGTTAAAIEVLEKNKFADTLCRAIGRAEKRARELAR